MASPPIRAFLFDFDGTLLDSLPGIVSVVRATEDELGLPVTSEEQIGHWIGNGAGMLVRRILSGRMQGDADPDEVQRVLPVMMRHYRDIGVREARFYPDALPLLADCAERGIQRALVTNKPAEVTLAVLDQLDAASGFESVVGGGDARRIKPYPDLLWLAAEQLELPPEQCLMVGDSRNDAEAARAAGMPFVAVRGGYNHGVPIEDSEPDRVFDSLAELGRSLDELIDLKGGV
ncbi:MAG: HAD family hydrolase [Pseudomonadota bacterium]